MVLPLSDHPRRKPCPCRGTPVPHSPVPSGPVRHRPHGPSIRGSAYSGPAPSPDRLSLTFKEQGVGADIIYSAKLIPGLEHEANVERQI